MQLKSPLKADVKKELTELEKLLEKLTVSGDFKITEASKKTLNAGGKRLRPALVFICGGLENKSLTLPAALAIETVHMASLVHDDLIDRASLRRGNPTVYKAYGKETAVRVGDFLFAKAFEKMSDVSNVETITILAKSAIDLTVGEILQQKTAYNPKQTESIYLSKIRFKTASLFEASCKIAAILVGRNGDEVRSLALYGENLGYAFQIFDDILDIIGDPEDTGKPTGSDLHDGIMTLPYIYAREENGLKDRIDAVLKEVAPSQKQVKEVIELVKSTSVMQKTKDRAKTFIDYASGSLKNVRDKTLVNNLEEIACFVVDRYH